MKKTRKLIALLLTLCLSLSLAACGNSAGGESQKPSESKAPATESQSGSNDQSPASVDKTYTATFENGMDEAVLDALPKYQFNANDLAMMIPYNVSLEITLDLDADGSYKLTSHWYNPDCPNDPSSAGYLNITTEGAGSYTMDGDKVTISAAESANATFEGGSYVTEQTTFLAFSFGSNDETGSWSSADVPEILECIPATVITVTDDGAIVTWEAVDPANAGNPHDKSKKNDAPSDDEPSGTAVDFVMTSPEWDIVAMNFSADGTCQFTVEEYGIAEDCTWTYADGVLTVTGPSGAAYTSTTEDGSLKLDYTYSNNDQVVGKFVSTDWQSFFEG